MVSFGSMSKNFAGEKLSACRCVLLILLALSWSTQFAAAQVRAPVGPGGGVNVGAIEVGRDGRRTLTGLGSVRCPNTVDLGFEIPGLISEILVREGDRVTAGQILARLDQTLVNADVEVQQARLKAAEAELRFRKAELAKMQELFNKEAISDTELKRAVYETEKAQAAIDLSEKEVESAKAKKKQMTLRAPHAGLVAKILLKEGEVVNYSSYQVMRLISCKEADAEIELAEKAYTSVTNGTNVRISVDALPGKTFFGRVYSVSPEINQKNRTFTAKARIANPNLSLRPGMFVRAEIDVTRALAGPIWVPAAAVLHSTQGSDAVFIVKDGVAVRREVRTGRQTGNRVEIVSGLNSGEVVIVDGKKRVSDLSEVNVKIKRQDKQ
jgi:membrane fusion protein, multidrug efflux system